MRVGGGERAGSPPLSGTRTSSRERVQERARPSFYAWSSRRCLVPERNPTTLTPRPPFIRNGGMLTVYCENHSDLLSLLSAIAEREAIVVADGWSEFERHAIGTDAAIIGVHGSAPHTMERYRAFRASRSAPPQWCASCQDRAMEMPPLRRSMPSR